MVIYTLDSSVTSTKLFGYFTLVLVLLPILIDYFNSSALARSLSIAAQLKL
jgi:hypothetical protein